MTAFATAQGLLQRLVDAIPTAWRQDPVFRGAAVGAGITAALLLLRLVGPHAPGLDGPTVHYDPATRQSWVGPRDAALPPQPLPLDVPKIVPGRSLGDVTVVPTPNGDRFGTFTPGKRP